MKYTVYQVILIFELQLAVMPIVNVKLIHDSIKLTIFDWERFTAGPLKRPLAAYIFFISDEGMW